MELVEGPTLADLNWTATLAKGPITFRYQAVVKVETACEAQSCYGTETQRHGETLTILWVSVSLWRVLRVSRPVA